MISVIICTYNPDQARLDRVLAALNAQTLARDRWELIVVDNASTAPVDVSIADVGPRVVPEPRQGLSWARFTGVSEARHPLVVFVDDDNVLDPGYLSAAASIASAHPTLGAFGGRSIPDWEGGAAPPVWIAEFHGNLALRDLGSEEIIQAWVAGGPFPTAAPIGAGMVARKDAMARWMSAFADGARISDRRGRELTSGGDNDIVITILEQGYSVGYFPDLVLTHIIPAARLEVAHQGRLSRGIAKSWVEVLALHDLNPWKPIAPWTRPLRQARAWLHHRPWESPARFVRFNAACGHFDGLAALARQGKGPSP
jgi:glycosyltransferase involved in cell wall biosynthesis